jgi:MFS family permease
MTQPDTPNNRGRLFLASFLAMIAIGMGFSARGAILKTWGAEFGFTQSELGVLTGSGLVGFGLTVMLFSVLVERWGYKVMLVATFALHFLSGAITLLATPIFQSSGKDAAFWCLWLGTMIFSVGNGAAEAVVNPLIAALYPTERTHRLNMLHAGFPGGLVLGALVGVILDGSRWELILLMYLVPTVIYGVLFVGQSLPGSRAKIYQASIGSMVREFRSPMMISLLLLMAMIGFVELGTDSWISNITGNLLADPRKGLLLFIWTSTLMFALRFVAGPIVHRISPLGLLFVAACFGSVGLVLLSMAGEQFNLGGAVIAATMAATIYAFGKTFYWGTMLGVTAERFPMGGALVIGAIGCVGNLSAGVLGGPAIGLMQDRFASQDLQQSSPAAWERYQSEKENSFLFVFHARGLDGSKVAVLEDNGKQLASDTAVLEKSGRKDENLERLSQWWSSARVEAATDKGPVTHATIHGGRMALRYTAMVPVVMALGFLLLIGYFRSVGGYRPVAMDPDEVMPLAQVTGVADDP